MTATAEHRPKNENNITQNLGWVQNMTWKIKVQTDKCTRLERLKKK